MSKVLILFFLVLLNAVHAKNCNELISNSHGGNKKALSLTSSESQNIKNISSLDELFTE